MPVPPVPSQKFDFAARFHDAQEAWFDGDYSRTLALLAEAAPRTASERADHGLLLARALLREGKSQKALDVARSVRRPGDIDRLATALMLEGAALGRLRRLDEAEDALEKARGVKGVHRTIVGEVLIELARVQYQRRPEDGALSRARALLVEAVGRADDIVLARAQELLGFVNEAERRYQDAARSYRQAFLTLTRSRRRDMFVEANIVNQMVSYATELLDVEVLADARAVVDRIVWNDDLAPLRFGVRQQLGWLALVAGETDAAWDNFHEALSATGTEEPSRVMALTNFASLYRTLGEPFAARRHVLQAKGLVEHLDWSETHGDGRMALAEWVIEARRQGLPVDEDLLAPLHARQVGAGDKAFDAADDRAKATIRTAVGLTALQGNQRRGLRNLDAALNAFESLGYHLRSAMVALDIYGVTQHPDYLDAAAKAVSGLKAGWLHHEVHEERKRDARGLADLTPAEREILTEVLLGKTDGQIAADTGRSQQTVKNTLQRVFRKLDVPSRKQLLLNPDKYAPRERR